MKWILIIIVLLVIGGALFVRTSRGQRVGRGGSSPHRLDDSTSAPDVSGLRSAPPSHDQAPSPSAATEPPGSDFAREPEVDDPSDDDPSAPDPRPSA